MLGLTLGLVSILALSNQLKANNKTNQVTTRGQLYQTDDALMTDEEGDRAQTLSSLWAYVPASPQAGGYARALLSLITTDSVVLKANSAGDLFHAINIDATLGRDSIRDVRTPRQG